MLDLDLAEPLAQQVDSIEIEGEIFTNWAVSSIVARRGGI